MVWAKQGLKSGFTVFQMTELRLTVFAAAQGAGRLTTHWISQYLQHLGQAIQDNRTVNTREDETKGVLPRFSNPDPIYDQKRPYSRTWRSHFTGK